LRARKRKSSSRGSHQLRRNPQQRRLAGTVSSRQRQALPGRNLQRKSPQGVDCSISLFDVFKPESGGRCALLAHRSAPHEIPQDFLGAGALSRVFFFGNRACLAAQFKAKDRVL